MGDRSVRLAAPGCAQDPLKIEVRLEFWESAPPDEDSSWHSLSSHLIACPSGYLRLGDDTGTAVGELRHPAGPGRYRVLVHHRGRDEAAGALRSIDEQHALTLDEWA